MWIIVKYRFARIWRLVIEFIDLVEFVQALQSFPLSDAVLDSLEQSKHAHKLLVRIFPMADFFLSERCTVVADLEFYIR